MGLNINNLSDFNLRSMTKTDKDRGKAFERLSSGKRINNAADDAAGLAIAEGLNADTAALAMAQRNMSDGFSVAMIADTAQATTGEALVRMRELAMQASNGTLSNDQRRALQQEYQALQAEVDRVAATTEFNGESVAGETVIQTGIDGSPTSQTTFMIAETDTSSLNIANTNLNDPDAARQALEATDAAIAQVSASRAEIGASMSRLETAFRNSSTQELAGREAESRIRDADVAVETAGLVRNNILANAQVSLQAQANLSEQNVLRLLG